MRLVCEGCGREFEASRRRKFCSSDCRYGRHDGGVAAAAASGDRLRALESLVGVLVDAMAKADDAQVPGLAARLLDVLRRIGGSDPTVLLRMRDDLARAVDRLARLQGQRDDKDRPLGTELAPMVRQLVAVIEAADEVSTPTEVNPLDDIAAARARRLAARRSDPSVASRSS
jgi:hypothetical protein